MATERFANGAQTTLADPINNSATVLIPSHTHSITGVNDAVAIRTATGTGFSWPAGGNGLAAVPNASGATGGGGAHNNVQPSAVVLYCIKT